MTGHCIDSKDCEKWKNCCEKCPDLKSSKSLFFDTTKLLFKLKRKIFYKLNFEIVVPTQELKNKFHQSPFLFNKKITVLPPSSDEDLSLCDSESIRVKYGIYDSDLVIGFFCSATANKFEIDKLLKNISLKKKAYIITMDAKFIINAENLVHLNIKSNKKNYSIIQVIKACSFCITYDFFDGIHDVVTKIMILEKLLISNNIEMVNELAEIPFGGMSVPNDSFRELNEAIQYFIINNKLASKYGEIAGKIARSKYSISNYKLGVLYLLNKADA
jgi:glycosyltransferase involved in cell wall biosynthesis